MRSMRQSIIPIFASLTIALIFANPVAALPEYSPNTTIIKFLPNRENKIDSFLSQSGATSANRVFPYTPGLSTIYLLKFPPNTNIPSIIRKYENDPLLDYIQPNYLNHSCADKAEIQADPNDLYYQNQWAHQVIEVRDAWETEKGSHDIIVAVIDTGVDYEHEDLKGKIWTNIGEISGNDMDDDGNGYIDDTVGWDFADSPGLYTDIDHHDRDNDPMDENGHGTHVAGIIGAIQNNSVGVAGITWNCQIMALRGGGDFLEDDDVSAAIVYAADNGARIINMSWGGDHLAYVIRDATEYAYSRGCVLIAAAGNSNRLAVIYPALHKHITAVGATNKWDKKASFSNYGPGIDIAAPGERIFSTILNNKYSEWSGTSMATPVVAGVAALMLSRRPALTNEEVAQILRSSAEKIDEPLFSGAKRVNAANALTASLPLVASISTPDSGDGADTALTISGKAAGSDFRKYNLEYSKISEAIWYPINASQGIPAYDDSLGIWNTENIDEGTYTIKLVVTGENGATEADKVVVYIDHSPPEITDLHVTTRLYYDVYSYAVAWWTDDLCLGELYYRPSGSEAEFQRMTTASISNSHSIYISSAMPPGEYEYFIRAINPAELSTVDNNNGDYYILETKSLRVSPDGFHESAIDIPALHLLNKSADFDGDGRMEIAGMLSSNDQYDEVNIYEINSSGEYREVFTSDQDYLPWDVGDTDGDGLTEILGNKRDKTFLYESMEIGAYPTEKIWEMEGIWGGQISDLDQDGQKEIISRDLDTNEIIIYESRGDNSYLKTARLKNPTEGRNNLASTIAISDFDGDGRLEMAVGDSDGHIFIYENTTNDRYEHTWTGIAPYSTAMYAASGDFDGDGTDEFIIGGRAAEPSNLARQKWRFSRWVYTIFDRSAQNEYEQVWSQEIIGAKLEGGISVGDLDGDDREEIAVLVTPNLYVFKYIEPGTCESIWYHTASNTGSPAILALGVAGQSSLFFSDEDKLLAFGYNAVSDGFTKRPWGVRAIPLDESKVELSWNSPPEAFSYKIYRGTHVDHLNQIAKSDQINVEYFRDTGLKKDTTYWYAVSSVDLNGQESILSPSDSATPNSPPRLLSAEYVSSEFIYLTFSEPMGASAQNSENYAIAPPTGHSKTASSAMLDFQGKRVILTTNKLSPGIHKVTASDIRDTTGVVISNNANAAIFSVPYASIGEWSDLGSMKVYPNPVMPALKHSARVTFENLPSDTEIRIYGSDGQLVREISKEFTHNNKKYWYLDNDQSQNVAGGTYIYIAKCSNDSRTGKIAIIR